MNEQLSEDDEQLSDEQLSEDTRLWGEAQKQGVLYAKEFSKFLPMSAAAEEEDFPCARIVRRARTLLSGRTDTEVEFIAEFCNMVVARRLIDGKVLGVDKDTGSEQVLTPQDAWMIAAIDFIKVVCNSVRDWIADSDDGTFSIGWMNDDGSPVCYVESLTVVDVLATSALVQFARAFQHNHVDWLVSSGIEHAVTAMECVVMAECHREHLREIEKKNSENAELRESMDEMHVRAAGMLGAMESLAKVRQEIQEKYSNLDKEIEKRAEEAAQKKISITNSRAAIKRHKENRDFQRDAIQFYEAHAHEFTSIEQAAAAIANRIVPVKHRTVVVWISKHRRLQRAHKL